VRRPHAALLLVLAIAVGAHAGDSRLEWRTVESPHFVVTYYEPNGDLAHRVAVVAERAHRVLAPALGHEPSEKTLILLTDDTDSANGYATVLPRNLIGLYATAPDSLSVLNDHDDWLYGLVAHEYSHILHLDTMGWLPRLYNRILGKTWAPNNVQPKWFIEGLATYEESKRSSSGRVRSAIFDMYLRVAVLRGLLLDLDAVSSGPTFWPHGDAVYLYGSFFLAYLAERFGDSVIANISHAYGEDPVPYGLNRAVAKVCGHDYLELYDAWRAELDLRYREQRDAVLRRGLIEGRKLTETGEQNQWPRYLRDGSGIAWLSADGKRAGRYRFLPRGPDTRARDLVRVDGAGHVAPLPGGGGAVVDRYMTYRTNYAFSDLFRVSWDGAVERLTHGLRASSPAVSPDGRRVAFTMNGGSRQRLAVMDLAPEAVPRVVWSGERWDQAYDPAWSPDGQRLVFSAWTEGGFVDLFLLELATGQARRLTHDRALDVTPVFAPDGRSVYFSSDRSGIYNVYALELASGALAQVTNVLGGAFSPDVSPDGRSLVYDDFDGDGYELYELALEPARFLAAEPYVDDRPTPTRIPDDESPVTPPRPYRLAETLLPRAYTLHTAIDSYGSAVTATTSGGDLAGQLGWYVSASYGLKRGDVGFGAAASWNAWWSGLSLAVGRGYGRYGGASINGRASTFHGEDWAVSAGVNLPVLRLPELASDLFIGFDGDWSRDLDALPPPRPDQALPVLPDLGTSTAVTLRWALSSVRGFVYSLGPVEGSGLSLSLRVEHPELGARRKLVALYYRWEQYFGLPFGGHALALTVTGALGDSDPPGTARFYLGGLPEQDVVRSILNSTRVGYGWLHGYPSGSVSGSQYHTLAAEYRVPLTFLERGLATLPFYVRRVHLAALADVAEATDGHIGDQPLKVALGAALRLDMTFGYLVPGTFELGAARGLSQGGDTQLWLLLTTGI
jgi:Tol biopolymer transport system component